MTTTLCVSLGFLLLYIIMAMKPGLLSGIYQKIVGLIYLAFSISFLVYIYQSTESWPYVILTIIGLLIFMFIIQLILGSIKHVLKKK